MPVPNGEISTSDIWKEPVEEVIEEEDEDDLPELS